MPDGGAGRRRPGLRRVGRRLLGRDGERRLPLGTRSDGWALDGLSGKPVSSVAVLGGEVWAATGEELWRRSADGAWSVETLPSSVAFPTTVAVDASGTSGSAGSARGGGRERRGPRRRRRGPGSSSRCSPIRRGSSSASRPGARRGGPDRAGPSYSGGVGPGEAIRALASFGGTLWAGTNITLYAWNGSAWVADAAFGGHDVRALTTWGGVLRAATADAGVLARSGSAWAADSTGILPRGGQAFLESGAELLVGTAGGGRLPAPVEALGRRRGPAPGGGRDRRVAARPVGLGDGGRRAPRSAAGRRSCWTCRAGRAVAPPGARPPSRRLRRRDGRREDARPRRPRRVVATSCGPYVVTESTAHPASAGLAARERPDDARVARRTVFGGTAGSGLWRSRRRVVGRELASATREPGR